MFRHLRYLLLLVLLSGSLALGQQGTGGGGQATGGGGGGGSGTVNPNSGSAGAVAYYPAAGGSTSVSPDPALTDAANLLSYTGTSGITATAGAIASGANGGAAGVLQVFGSTSGSATFTAPAVAGTVTNPVVSSNSMQFPVGGAALPSVTFAGHTDTGIWYDATNVGMGMSAGGGERFIVNGSGLFSNGSGVNIFVGSAEIYGWTTGAGGSAGSADTGLSRASAGVVDVGNGTAANKSGQLNAQEVDLGINGTSSGVLGFLGSTSGKATFTAPAVAGTTTNGVVATNNLVMPANSPAITFGGNQGFGTNNVFGNVAVFATTNTTMMMWVNGGVFEIPNSSGMAWSSTIDTNTNPPNTQITRKAAALISSDSSTPGDGLGAFTNCRTTTNVTPVTVNANVTTDQNLMTFTLPANCLNTVGRTLRVFVAGVYSTAANSTAQMTLKIKICSVSGCGSGNVASVINIQSAALATLTITNNAWNGTFYITTQTGSTAGAWEAHGAFGIDEGSATTSADSFFNDQNTATVTGSPAAIDTTAQNFLQITFAFSAGSSSNSVTQRQLVLDSVL